MSLNGTHNEQPIVPAEVPVDLDEAGNLPFGERMLSSKWQIRKHLYEQLSGMFENE